MTVALLVLAFREPDVLKLAIPIYRAAGFEIFIHLDKKANAAQYRAKLAETANVCQFVPTSLPIYWGGYSMIEAEMVLINFARQNGEFSRYTLISDDTFPLLRPDRLRQFSLVDHDRIMIRKLPIDDQFMTRYTNYFYLDHQATSLLGRPIETAIIDDDLLLIMDELKTAKKLGKKAIDVYYGSQWWSITEASMRTILERLKADAHLLQSFKFSAVPDEFLFQTLIGNFVPRSRVRSGPVFVDWSKNPKPYMFKTLDELPFDKPEYAFARKFSGQGLGLLNEIMGRPVKAETV